MLRVAERVSHSTGAAAVVSMLRVAADAGRGAQPASGRLGSRRLRRKPPPAPTQAAAGSGILSGCCICPGRARATRRRCFQF